MNIINEYDSGVNQTTAIEVVEQNNNNSLFVDKFSTKNSSKVASGVFVYLVYFYMFLFPLDVAF